MAKIEVAKVADILRQNELTPAAMRRIIEQINAVTEAAAVADEEKPPAQKKQFVILVSDPDGRIDGELGGWVLQIPEEASPLSVSERIQKATFDFNATRRGRKLPAETVGEALEVVPAKNFKDVEIWVRTKTPVLVLTTDNKLPGLSPTIS